MDELYKDILDAIEKRPGRARRIYESCKSCMDPWAVSGGVLGMMAGFCYGVISTLYPSAGGFFLNEVLMRLPDYVSGGIDMGSSFSYAKESAQRSLEDAVKIGYTQAGFSGSCGYGIGLKFKNQIKKFLSRGSDE